jgi:hypothetical protein
MKYFLIALILSVSIFSCSGLWEADLKYVITGSGSANITYTFPNGAIGTLKASLPESIIFQSFQLTNNIYSISSDNGYLYIYHSGVIVAEGANYVEWNR